MDLLKLDDLTLFCFHTSRPFLSVFQQNVKTSLCRHLSTFTAKPDGNGLRCSTWSVLLCFGKPLAEAKDHLRSHLEELNQMLIFTEQKPHTRHCLLSPRYVSTHILRCA